HYCIADTPVILINEMEIRQMVFNLVQNGFDAMPMGGTLTLKTFSQDRHVVLVVQDHGTGIDETILDKLGTPFLTTKDHGTGLGLAVCYGIA
ncbi:ATP-binding protein, partial [Klebsiella pneumoniae]|nr:ATP-binding protein [Klebsiella pneumoniae]MCP6663549.1 ATP-binding protein [Klebsiella pneumoniae]